MDYLTQHYKNLSEQLQAKVNHLTQLIENQTLTPDNHDGPDAGSKGSADEVSESTLKATIESSYGFHDDIVHALSHHLGTAYPHLTARDNMYRPDPEQSILDIRKILHGSAPKGGYRTFDQAHDTLQDIVMGDAHQGRNAMYNAINAGIGFDEAGDSIVDHAARDENAGRVLSDITKKSIGMLYLSRAKRY